MSDLEYIRLEDALEAAEECVVALRAAYTASLDVMPVSACRLIQILLLEAETIERQARRRLFNV